jgi:signal transduction histidine kinase
MAPGKNITLGTGIPEVKDSAQPPDSYIVSECDKQLWSDLPVAAFSLSILYLLFAAAHPFTVGGPAGTKLSVVATASSLVLLLYALWLRRSKSIHLANLTAATFAGIVLVNAAFHLLATRDPAEFSNFVVLVVAIGTFFLSLRWCIGAIAAVGAAWAAVTYLLGGDHAVHYVFGFITSSVVAALAFRFHTRALRSSIAGVWRETRHREQLEAVDAELVRANTELEQRVTERTAELQNQIERTRSMEQAVLESEKVATAGRMAATLAHEINNPLDAIVNCLYLLDLANLSPREQKYLELAREEVQRVVRITRHTLGFYRSSETPEEFDCSALATEVIAAFQPVANERGVQLEARIESGQMLNGFPGEIRQLLTNLIINAMDAGGTVARVSVVSSCDRMSPERRGLRISVADNGKGISKEHGASLFEPFFTTKGEKGTGLGLWVCKGIVQKHNGTIGFRSIPRPVRACCVFSVFLPSEPDQRGVPEHSGVIGEL